MTRRFAALALGVLAAMVALCGVDLPYSGEWDFFPALEKCCSGRLAFADLWRQDHEHRVIFQRGLMLLMARASAWDVRWELAASLVLALAAFLVVARRFDQRGWALAVAAGLSFSLAAWGNWLWGIQVGLFLSFLAFFGAITLLLHEREVLASLCAVVASYSFATGLLAWPVGLALLWSQRRKRAARIWGACGLAVGVLYFAGYEPQGPPGAPLSPPRLLAYVLIFLGSPLCSWSDGLASLLGLSGLAGFVVLWRRERPPEAAAWAAYAVGGAAMAAVGRSGEGLHQALSTRYITMAVPLWLGLLLLIERASLSRKKELLGSLAALMLANSAYGALGFLYRDGQMRLDRDELRRLEPHPVLTMPWPPAEETAARSLFLKEHRLSLFRDGVPPPRSGPEPAALTPGFFEGEISRTELSDGRSLVKGWALERASGLAPRTLFFYSGGRLAFSGRPYIPHLARAVKAGRIGALVSGFSFIFPRERLGPDLRVVASGPAGASAL
ncbi:MAG: hypothetical protein HY077_02875 [Elusimicrobia bacterium]|nr:hypothetical protein [Elusimicrobiota bacterium]